MQISIPLTLILCGGLGTRLKDQLGNVPKIMAPICNRPFLDWLLRYLDHSGVKKFHLALGVGSQLVIEHIQQSQFLSILDISYTIEPTPLGTAGAISYCLDTVHNDEIVVMNGDTFATVNFTKFVTAWHESGSDSSLITTRVADTSRYGALEFDEHGYVLKFLEKRQSAQSGWINAGIYGFKGQAITHLRSMKTGSLEKGFLEKLRPPELYANQQDINFLDIGTPQSLLQAEIFLKKHMTLL